MTRNEFIAELKKNLKPNAQMDFLLIGYDKNGKFLNMFIDINDITMNVDFDDPDNKNRGGIVFEVKKDLSV